MLYKKTHRQHVRRFKEGVSRPPYIIGNCIYVKVNTSVIVLIGIKGRIKNPHFI